MIFVAGWLMVGNWRIIDADLVDPITGVATVEAISKARSQDLVTDTIILWRPVNPFVCLGYFQLAREEVYADACEKLDVKIARRILGGGTGYCDQNQILYDVILGADHAMVPTSKNIEALYTYVLRGVVRGIKQLGLDDVQLMPDYNFAIWVNGKKVSGNAATGLAGAQIVGGSLLIDFDYDMLMKIFRNPFKALKPGINYIEEGLTYINRELPKRVEINGAKVALKKGFEAALNIKLIYGSLIDEEVQLLKSLEPKFLSRDWTYLMDIKYGKLMP